MPDQIYKFAPEEVWFTSDTHFGHENIIRYCNRPFRNAEEMNAELIRRWRETVPENGIVFHLGDFAHGNARLWNDILSALPGRKYLILGNHDMKALRQGYMGRFELVTQQMTIRVGGQAIVLNHNPFLCYGGSYRDVWQLFGHVHSGPGSHTGLDHPRLRMLFPLQYDVGVDNNGFRPISFAEVKAKIEAQLAAAKAAAGIKDDGHAPDVRKIVFLDSGTAIGSAELKRLREADTGMEITCAYTQSDEISLLFAKDAQVFGRRVRKLNSILAGTASARFSLFLGQPAVFDCRIIPFPNQELVTDYFRWRMEDAHRNCLNSWCYWTLRKEGLSASKASKELEGKSIAFKNELLFQRGINFNDLPVWQRRGVGIYWREYQKIGHNPITGEDIPTTRREVFADYDLQKGFVKL